MPLNESLVQAFETIREYASFDCLSPVPHVDNLRFSYTVERQTMHRLGTKLAEIVCSPDCEDMQYVAHTVKRHFWKELGLTQPPELPTDLPRFLLKDDFKLEIRIDPFELVSQLAIVPLPETPAICIVSSKLALLQKLLNLSDTAIKYLTLAYAISCRHNLTKDDSSGLDFALSNIGLIDDVFRNHAISTLLDSPLAEVETMFAPPCTLVALRFVDAAVVNQRRSLCNVFALTDEFVSLLETKFRSHEAVLAAILEPEQDFDLLDDGSTPIGYLYEILPKDIAEAYECAVLERPLYSLHIYAVVKWFTGGFNKLEPSFYSPLAGRMTFENIREATKQAALDCCRANVPLDAFAILRALYAASKPVDQTITI